MNIILVHGILGFRKIGAIDYFLDVAQHFKAKGYLPFAPQLDPTQGISFRGDQLRRQIEQAFISKALDPQQKTHIIAHSMGGLDSRYMLSPANLNRIQIPITSLTTIGTPHLGSPIADVIDNPAALLPFPHLPFASPMTTLVPFLNALGISENGLRDLRTGSCQAFSAKYVDNPNVRYFSCAGSGRLGLTATAGVFMIFHHYISGTTGESNDGLVAVSSAKWGVFDPTTWPCDHAEEVGHNLDNLLQPTPFPYLDKYDEIVNRAAAL